MNKYRFALALGVFCLVPFAGCRSHDGYHQMKSAETTEWRSCCGMECNSECQKACCKDYFENKGTTSTGPYKNH